MSHAVGALDPTWVTTAGPLARGLLPGIGGASVGSAGAVGTGSIRLRGSPEEHRLAGGPPRRVEVLAVGSSTGGPEALATLLHGLRQAPARPILITQHMPPAFTAMLATQLSFAIGRTCAEAVDGEPVRADGVYLAPGGLHMLVETGRGGVPVLRLSRAEPENFCRPAVDPMLRSVARTYGARSVAVILTGMGRDGARGCAAIQAAGGTVVVQDEGSSVVWGMPGAVARSGLADAVLPVDGIARLLLAKLAGEATR